MVDGLRWVQLTEDTEIMEGVRLFEAPGHTWGTMCLMVDLPNTGTMIFTSDAAYMRESYGPPPVGAAIVWDSLGWLDSVERIRSFANMRDATIIFGHDPKPINELRLAPEAIYDDVHVEPTDKSFEAIASFVRGRDYDGFVAIGGGSSIDTAKAANLFTTYPAPVMDYVNKPIGKGVQVPGPLKPLVAIPTTAG